MEEVIAVSFRDRHRAAQAFNLLWQMNDKLVIELDDAVIVHRDRYGNLEYDQESSSTFDRGLIRAGLWGCVVGGLAAILFAVGANVILDPAVLGGCVLTGGLFGVVAGVLHAAEDAAPWKDEHCALKRLVPEVVGDISPCGAAVVAWVDSAGLETAAPAFRGLGGKVLRTTLPSEEVAILESVLNG